MRPENVTVFDFDGTLIKVNSFREITKRLSIILLKNFQIVPLLAISTWYILRKCGIIPHLKFKQHIVNIFEKSLTEEEKKGICQAVFDDNVNQAVFELMVKLDNCIICTAAPFAYISRVSFNKYVPVISSLDPENGFPDISNFGAGKIENLKAFFKRKDIQVENFFTDSNTDDQALIDFSANAFLVEGDRVTKVK
jgi:hypothetical protein